MSPVSLVLAALLAVPAAGAGPVPVSVERDAAAGTVKLNIPDLGQAAGAPSSGWCGEAAIQQALFFLGAWFPQREINRAGKPANPDLYSNEIPVALANLQVRFRFAPRPRDLGGFIQWIKDEVDEGRPVFTGMKIYPTTHPEWGLDHFTLAVGHDRDALVINTTWKDQRTISAAMLRSTSAPLAFANASGHYYGLSLLGADSNLPRLPTRLFVVREAGRNLEVVVKCEGLEPGREYRVLRARSFRAEGAVMTTFTATAAVHAVQAAIDRDAPAVFRCVELR